jgi:hypothetical protein
MGGSEAAVGTDYIVRRRLSNQRIVGGKFERPEEVVRWLGAVQAQDYAQSLWAVGLRLGSATLGDVEEAIAEARIVRTWPMRGTIHFVPAEDVGWMLKLSASRMLAADGRRLGQLGLDRETMGRCAELFRDALEGGRRLSRPSMMDLLEGAGIGTGVQRGYHILWHLSQAGLICPGPMQDKQQTFVLLDEWVPHARELSREEALAELAGRYFVSHGPATVHDFARWAGLTVTETRKALEAAPPNLASEKIDGKDYWSGRASGRAAHDDRGVHLLPGFDEYLLGYGDRSAVLASEHAQKIVPGNNGIFLPTIVVAGRVVGTWKRKLKRDSVGIQLRPFAALGASEEEIVAAAECYCDFVGLPLSSVETEPSG